MYDFKNKQDVALALCTLVAVFIIFFGMFNPLPTIRVISDVVEVVLAGTIVLLVIRRRFFHKKN